ncbi:nitrogenase iron-molybdenum cofactor biosynthesis protein NifN [Methylocystis sp. Sn-Cys]|uniref:nitrogenase iron-molybdenum cofactor biosynthesis protein NifN n=1 Tax=Methylocystis sp. Sn-Cys TaxID=1701263 RepID=UPI0019227FB3|nr:nitrogenase iron-molybdenum cofactor biosynthesis protein NifN [Methylocystis sp. Sn-Cys]MBL1257908.1 nitrogenase iron-molybdenum cofactor biosynthesis protein NifN [Methylocystis sp. Sn-Cys]
MARVTVSKKSCAVNPLKMSQPIGGALAFMGVSGCMPVLHGSQGCTSFGLVLFVRHFKEAIPLQTTAMNEVATVLGGLENIEQAILNIVKRAKPQVIGICSTGVTETKGDDVDGYLQLVRKRHPELDDIGMVYVSTPDFKDAFQDGFGKTVTKLIETFVPDEIPSRRAPQRVNVLAGCHLTPGDIDELRDIIEAFGLEPTFLPDLSGSLDGHIPDDFTPTTLGGVTKEDIAAMGSAAWTIAVGEQMRAAAELLQKRAGVRYELFERLTGLAPNDELIGLLSRISGRPVPIKFRRQRGQLVDAMLDGHFHFGGKRIAIGAEPDLLFAISQWLTEMGAEVTAAVTTTHSPVLEKIMTEEVLIGDLEDLENRLAGCDLMITHSHGRQASERSGVPLYRMGLPMFDRIGAAHELSVGYRGTRDLIFKLGNLFIDQVPEPTTETWRGESAEHDGTTLASENDIAPISAH